MPTQEHAPPKDSDATSASVVLMVAEKPSIALSIATFLSANDFSTRADGPCPTHEYRGSFRGKRAVMRVTSVKGHVYNLDFEKAYESWESDPALLFSAGTVKVPTSVAVVQHLQREARGVAHLVLWLDCDREGENICFEVMHNVCALMARRAGQQVWRARFSAVSEPSFRAAMADLREPNEHEASAVDARQELDLRMGVAFTRFQCKYLHGRFPRLDAKTLSYGPCQTPTLAFVVRRHLDILSHVPEAFWRLRLQLRVSTSTPAADGQGSGGADVIEPEWERGRVFDEKVAQAFELMAQREASGKVLDVNSVEERRARPEGMNTVTLLKVCSAALGIGAQRTMHAAEALYMAGFLSYPRTESSGYPKGFDFEEVLREQAGQPDWGDHAAWLLEGHMVRPRAGVDAGDHPPITPVGAGSREQVLRCGGAECWRVYELVSRTFLASLCPDAAVAVRCATFVLGGEMFTLRGLEVVQEGWYRVQPHLRPQELRLPPLEVGSMLPVHSLRLEEGQTQPPQALSESELISEMERNGIGTDASIPTHISNIETRQYVRTIAGRRLQPTALGLALIQGYRHIDPELILPTVRSHVERCIALIARGEMSRAAVVRHLLDEMLLKFRFFVRHASRMAALFDAAFGQRNSEGQLHAPKLMSRCGETGRYLELVEGGEQGARLYNPHTQQVWPLPQGGSVKPYKERTCPVCGFGLLLFTISGRRGTQRCYPLCPSCFSRHPLPDRALASDAPCYRCPHPEAHPIVKPLCVCACPESAASGGMMLLDPTGAPAWRLVSSQGAHAIRLPPFIHKLSVGARCGCTESCRLLRIEFQRERSPLPNGETVHEGCVLNDELIQSMAALAGTEPTSASGKGGRPRSRKGAGGKGSKASEGSGATGKGKGVSSSNLGTGGRINRSQDHPANHVV
ncbi:hypothetical protein AB1Y20_011203 [Prymnesium parvum]|uniref:DNA topoisomerase n=1 Tax=Prymnesium parvum TaxID=97485 RepID=A0AB34INJ9_PRYPA